MHFKGITVELTGPNGIPFAEYKDPVDFKDTDDMSHVLIELPPPEARQEFAIRYRVSDKTYFAADNVGGKRGFSIRFFFEETERNFLGDFSGKVIFGVRDNFEVVEEVYYGCDKETNKSFYTKPKFARIDVGEMGKQGTVTTHKSKPSGLVDVKLWKCDIINSYKETITKSIKHTGSSVQAVSEKIMKGKDVTHGVDLKSGVTSRPPEIVWNVRREAEPFHVFRFHYRTKAALISRRIIQPDPADDPEPDSDSEPEKDEEDEVEKLRKQKKELKRQLGLMQERLATAATAATTAETLTTGGDDDIQILPAPKKRRVVVDLTDD